MHRDEAKKILALHRPGIVDETDPQMIEALDLVQRDPELAAWFDQHCAVFNAIRGKLKAIPVPQGLRKQILAEHVASTRILPLTNRMLFAAAMAALVLLTAVVWTKFVPSQEARFEGYRARMVKTVQRDYFMEMLGRDQVKIREYFHSKGAPDDYVLPKSLESLAGRGGGVFTWNNHQVSLLCLLRDVKNPVQKNDLYLFMANRAVIPGAPAPDAKAEFKKVNKLETVSWTVGDRVFLLAGFTDEATLRKYIE